MRREILLSNIMHMLAYILFMQKQNKPDKDRNFVSKNVCLSHSAQVFAESMLNANADTV